MPGSHFGFGSNFWPVLGFGASFERKKFKIQNRLSAYQVTRLGTRTRLAKKTEQTTQGSKI
jgi:hypothetical protein